MGGMADALIKEETCRADPSIGFTLDTTFGGRMILLFGTDEQKEEYLPKLASAELTGAIAISEPDAGSANRYMRTRAAIEGDEYVLNGEKMWITNAPVADYLLVMARTDPESMPGDRDGISAILVPTDLDGVNISTLDLMGLDTGRTGQVVFDDVHVPRENLVGNEGEGYAHLLDWFNVGRNYVGPMALGIAQGAYDLALQYAPEREAFGKPISEYQAIRHKLANMATDIEATRLLCYQSAQLQDEGETSLKLASMAKLMASEVAEEVASEALQIHGGYGYSTEFAVERYYRAAKVTQIVEGTSEVQRNLIASAVL
jgi:alkylation response protein AidB-like acyl-CoA dehydrogenase